MSSVGLGVALVLAAIALLGGLGQILAYRREGSVLSRTQLLLRLTMALLLLAMIALSVWGLPPLANPGLTSGERLMALRQAVGFVSVVALLAVAIMVLAIIDLRHLRAAQHRARAQMYRNLARLQEDLRTHQQVEESADSPRKE